MRTPYNQGNQLGASWTILFAFVLSVLLSFGLRLAERGDCRVLPHPTIIMHLVF
jgi:hypothetical protein